MMGNAKRDSLVNDQSFQRPVTFSTCACDKGKASNECGNETSEDSSYEISPHHSLRGSSDYCEDDGYGDKFDVGGRSVALTVPDGGWGWMVAVGSFVVMMLVPVLFPCFGILFSGYLLSKETSSLTTAWIFNIQGFIWNIMGLFVRPLVDDIGWRGVGFVGITLVSISLLVSAFTPSPLFLFFSFSLLSGVGGGLVTSMCFLIVPIYFKRRRGMANAITMMGICSGEILGPLLVHLLLDEYGFLGACLIISAIILNGYIGILLFHPVEWHMQRNIYQVQSIHNESISPVLQTLKTDAKEERIIICLHKNNLIDNGLSVLLKDSEMLKDQKVREINEPQSLHKSLSSSSWNIVPASLIGYGTSLSESLHDVMKETRYNTTEPLGKGSDSVISRISSFLRRVIGDLAVLRSPRAAIIATGNMLCMNSVLNFVMMVPFAMQALDHPLQDSARCISVSAFCNLLTRMVVSPLSDWTRFSKRLCYMGGYALLALSMFMFPMLSDLKWLEVAMGLFGCGLGANMALYNLVMIEYMGVDNLPPIFGASGLMVGLGFLVFGTVSGLFRDVTGSYGASMWMLSAMAATSFSLWLLMPMAAAYDEKRRLKGGSTTKFEESSLSGATYPSEAIHHTRVSYGKP